MICIGPVFSFASIRETLPKWGLVNFKIGLKLNTNGKFVVATLGVLMIASAFLFQNCGQPAVDSDLNASQGTVVGDSKYRLPSGGSNDQFGTGITCGVAVNSTSIAVGGTFVYTVTATGALPTDYRVYAYGNKNGVPDASEITPIYTNTLVQTYTNPGYIGGNYQRSFQIRDSNGRTLCATNSVNLLLAGPSCVLSTTTPTLKVGNVMVLNITYGAGTVVPTDKVNVQFNGLNNGLTIPAIPYDGTSFTQYSKVMGNADAGNGYTRRITIRNADSSIYCETNSLYLLVKP